ncbi:hypothetical protein SKAU_G00054950 [Synaphobranchus kaupii]|uniref:Uncharacterized protein n=1 Tax=Synaphobranchus kaupii TaxID=118154 RepID=A0A9Q1G563_SYNKA|nr:hypothetical protein SKAU_G00054950 [Synaphobranchus kaupii]
MTEAEVSAKLVSRVEPLHPSRGSKLHQVRLHGWRKVPESKREFTVSDSRRKRSGRHRLKPRFTGGGADRRLSEAIHFLSLRFLWNNSSPPPNRSEGVCWAGPAGAVNGVADNVLEVVSEVCSAAPVVARWPSARLKAPHALEARRKISSSPRISSLPLGSRAAQSESAERRRGETEGRTKGLSARATRQHQRRAAVAAVCSEL